MSLKPYPANKDSGVEWIGDIPASWNVVPLWWLFQRSKRLGRGNEELLSVYRDYGVIPKSSRDDNFNKASEDLSKYQVVETGDLVINKMKAWQGSVAISEHDGIVSPAYFVFKHLKDMNLRFMHYLMRSVSYFQHYASISAGVRPNQWDLDPGRHRVMGVLCPPSDEQQLIVDFLDRETAEIDAFIADQEELITLLNERRAATITQAVTKGLDPAVPMKESGVEWLGSMPSAWIVEPIKRVASIRGRIGFRGYTTADLVSADEGAVTLSPGNMREGRLRWENSAYISWEKYVESPEIIVEDQDILLVKTGSTFGKVSFVELPNSISATINPQIVILRAETILKRFLYYAIDNSRVYSEFRSYPTGGTTPTMTETRIGSIHIVIPDLQSQRLIVGHLDRETAEIDATIADAKQAVALSKERRAALISAAVTGKIDVRGAVVSKQQLLEGELVVH